MTDPLTVDCMHFASHQEKARDRDYFACHAVAGQPCSWAKRFDGETDPPFHSERIEDAILPAFGDDTNTATKAQFDAAVLASGEIAL